MTKAGGNAGFLFLGDGCLSILGVVLRESGDPVRRGQHKAVRNRNGLWNTGSPGQAGRRRPLKIERPRRMGPGS
jgi:hypothetical protein